MTYANFSYAVEGTGVWVPAGTFDVGFYVDGQGGGPYVHRLQAITFEPLSPTSVAFTGAGYYVPGPGWTETIEGLIDGDQVTFTMFADDPYFAGYNWSRTIVQGTIASDGSVAGTWDDDHVSGARTGTFVIADIGHEVFGYTADVTCVGVAAPDALFGYTIPVGVPLAGVQVVVGVHDAGPPGAWTDTEFDTWMHGVGNATTCDADVGNYPIIAGNLTVFP